MKSPTKEQETRQWLIANAVISQLLFGLSSWCQKDISIIQCICNSSTGSLESLRIIYFQGHWLLERFLYLNLGMVYKKGVMFHCCVAPCSTARGSLNHFEICANLNHKKIQWFTCCAVLCSAEDMNFWKGALLTAQPTGWKLETDLPATGDASTTIAVWRKRVGHSHWVTQL
jgi:hypothetical protein